MGPSYGQRFAGQPWAWAAGLAAVRAGPASRMSPQRMIRILRVLMVTAFPSDDGLVQSQLP